MDLAGRDKDMNARVLRVSQCVPGQLDILRVASRQAADRGSFDAPRDCLHGAEIARGSCRETCLDDIHLEFPERSG